MRIVKKVFLTLLILQGFAIIWVATQIPEISQTFPEYRTRTAQSTFRRIEGLTDAEQLFHTDVLHYDRLYGIHIYGTYQGQNFDDLVGHNDKWYRIHAGPADIKLIAEKAAAYSHSDSYFEVGYLMPDIVYEYMYADVSHEKHYAYLAFFAPNYHCFLFNSIILQE